jgi:flagellar biosynthesis/type III secretory pathway ATPase
LSKLVGKRINSEGKVINGIGKAIDEAEVTSKIERQALKEKFFSKLAGYTVDEQGQIVTSRGNIIGRLAENASKMLFSRNHGWKSSEKKVSSERSRSHRRGVSLDLSGLVLDGNGDAIGKITSGDVERCVDKMVNDDGDIVDDTGSVWGHF